MAIIFPFILSCACLTLLTAAIIPAASSTELERTSGGQLFKAPAPDRRSDWLAELRKWRDGQELDRSRYEDPRLAWARGNFVQSLVIVQERTLYDPVKNRYTVDRYLEDVRTRFGGVDSVILWHTYPNIGIDDRNQHDHLRDMPGGLDGLKRLVDDFHRRGVRVLIPIMPWDTGTREEKQSLAAAMARDAKAIGADGLFGDTLNGVPHDFAETSPSLVVEPELNLGEDRMLAWNTVSWGQFWEEPLAPGISVYKWLEPRHMVHVTSRWATDRSGDLQRAFLNGTGYQAWENIWGLWNGISGRDAANLRRYAMISRRWEAFLTSPEWEPYTRVERPGVFASRFSHGEDHLWTLVNRSDLPVNGIVLRLPHEDATRYWDLWNGRELRPGRENNVAFLTLEMDAHGFGAVLATRSDPTPDLREFLQEMSNLPAADDTPWRVLRQRFVPIERTKTYVEPPEGMIRIPGATFTFRVSGVEIEGDDAHGVDVEYPWEDAPRRQHERTMNLQAFYIDRTPVTNSDFHQFVTATRYKPRDGHNFLRHWINGSYPEGWAKKPVTWISLEDARAYAKWAGKRLPHEWEWQYAAQGSDGRAFPWGPEWNPKAVPIPDTGRTMRPPADVGSFPDGASPFGVLDLVGSVWQWTEEVLDDHTRAAILRGGSSYRPGGSHWYFPPADRLDQHGKYLLMSPGKDRSGAIGFRCAADAESS